MNSSLSLLLIGTLALASTVGASGRRRTTAPPSPYGVLPSQRQLDHSDLDQYAFLHFNMNTFTDREWGNGDEDPSTFNPDAFNPDRIVMALKAAGMKGVMLTCKHHDGFCLWPTKATDHSVANSKWEGGHGDVVRGISDACKRHGLKFGVYLSPWDRNNAAYGKPEYIAIYRQQLTELLTNYGPIFEIWHDGANGGSGYYGGARETRSIDRKTYYDWPTTWALVRKLQPGANIFSDIGPDLRWVGNEAGHADDTCWQTFSPVGNDGGPAAPGDCRSDLATSGTRNGLQWLPAECDVSIRPGWFWHEADDSKVKSPAELLNLYYGSVGHGAFFILNVPPNRYGVISDPDVASLKAYGDILRETFSNNLAKNATLIPSNTRGNDSAYSAKNLLGDNRNHYWATDDEDNMPSVELDLTGPKTFDVIRLKEAIQLGQRVDSFSVDAWQDGDWKEIASATSVGTHRLIRLDQPITTNKVRLRVTKSPVCVALYGFGLFKEPSRG